MVQSLGPGVSRSRLRFGKARPLSFRPLMLGHSLKHGHDSRTLAEKNVRQLVQAVHASSQGHDPEVAPQGLSGLRHIGRVAT